MQGAATVRDKQHTNPMDIHKGRVRKIIIDHTVDTFKIHTPGNNISGNQNPCFASSEVVDSIFSLYLL
jgi:hypothetical protein